MSAIIWFCVVIIVTRILYSLYVQRTSSKRQRIQITMVISTSVNVLLSLGLLRVLTLQSTLSEQLNTIKLFVSFHYSVLDVR